MLWNFFLVLSDASAETMTSQAFPVFTAFSVENSPLTILPALVESPISDSTLLQFNRIQLPFQVLINLLRNLHLQGTFQPFVLDGFLQTFL